MPGYAPAGAERFRLYSGGGLNPDVVNSGLAALSTPSQGGADEGRPWHPSSPLFAFAVVTAAAVAAIAYGTGGSAGASFHLGKLKAGVAGSAGVGK